MDVADGKLTIDEFVNFHEAKFSALDDATFRAVYQLVHGADEAAARVAEARVRVGEADPLLGRQASDVDRDSLAL